MIGRLKEVSTLKEAAKKNQAQLIAVYGRRRVGKTFLVREVFSDAFFFQHTGIHDVPMSGQLAAFRDSLIEAGASNVPELADWREAFNELKRLVKAGAARKTKRKSERINASCRSDCKSLKYCMQVFVSQ